MQHQPERAEKVLWDILRRLGLDQRIREGGAVLAWAGAVGPGNATRSRAVVCKGGRLIVEVDSSPWMQELSCMKTEIRAAINRELGEDVVKDVLFRLAAPTTGSDDATESGGSLGGGIKTRES